MSHWTYTVRHISSEGNTESKLGVWNLVCHTKQRTWIEGFWE